MLKFNKIPAGVIALAFFIAVFSSCSVKKQTRLTIWTDRGEIASCIEEFNATHSKTKAVIVYKENLATSLPPEKDEQNPDIILGSWLKNDQTLKNFKPLNYLFLDYQIRPSQFYRELLSYGAIADNQFLLPVSFDLPAALFSISNESLISKKYDLSLDDIKQTGERFNSKNKKGFFTRMGFAPTWNTDFLYLAAKINGFSVRQKGENFIWNDEAVSQTVAFLKDWTTSINTSASTEQDFSFKYLYTPDYKFVNDGRCLFAYTTAGTLFETPWEQLDKISFRWISKDGQLPVEDDVVMLGIYKKARNIHGANDFIRWLFQEETQKSLLVKAREMGLYSQSFGIFGGFSSIISVNEHIFPGFYQTLLGNIPKEGSLTMPQIFPVRWDSLKERVLIPYLQDMVFDEENPKSLESRTFDWSKRYD